MEKRELTCISCPMGCQMTVSVGKGEIKVTGNTCKRGEIYAKKEVTDPRRVVTSSIRVKNGDLIRVSVKTETDIKVKETSESRSFIDNDLSMRFRFSDSKVLSDPFVDIEELAKEIEIRRRLYEK